VLHRPISIVPRVPVCSSSSMFGHLSWMYPLSSSFPCSDLSLVSWELLFPWTVSIPSLPPQHVCIPILPPPPLSLWVFIEYVPLHDVVTEL
jgi:hypothetical protein